MIGSVTSSPFAHPSFASPLTATKESEPTTEVTQGAAPVEQGEAKADSQEDRQAPRGPTQSQELSTEDELAIRKLQARDREVRAHEQAHKSAGGQLVTGGPTYQYETGPNGQRYAVGGEVSIEVSPVSGNPEATIQKARMVRRAALAPANPSGTDRGIAARASAMEQQARAEMAKEFAAPEEDGEPEEAAPESASVPEPSESSPNPSRPRARRLDLHV